MSNQNNNVKPASFAQLERLMRLLEDQLVPVQQKSFIRKYLANRNKTMRGASIVIRKTIESKGQMTYGAQLKVQREETISLEEYREMNAFLNKNEQLGLVD